MTWQQHIYPFEAFKASYYWHFDKRAHKTSPQTTVHPRLGKVQIPIKHQLSDCWIKLGLFCDWTRNRNQTLSSPHLKLIICQLTVYGIFICYIIFFCAATVQDYCSLADAICEST
jgi:hypothetical protein